jgi:hypothetical protein
MAGGIRSHSSSFYSGIGGRVVIGGQVAIYIKEWSLEVSTEIYGSPTFESPVYDELAWDVKRFIGLSEAKIELSGYALATTVREIGLGQRVQIVLYVSVDGGVAISANAVVQNISYSQDATGTSPVEIKLSLEVDGPVELPEG